MDAEAEGGDEPLTGGASRQRVREQPNQQRQVEGDATEAISIDGAITLLRQLYGARIEAARRNTPAHDRAAMIRALRNELKAAIRAVTERKRETAAARRKAAAHRREACKPKPDNTG